jgi:hypothetical protein
MAFPVILYDSILRDTGATVVASSTETGDYAASYLLDFLPWKMWKSGTLVTGINIDIDLGADTGTADTIGLVNHNITSEAGTVELRADTSAGANPPTTVRQAAYTPTYGDVDLKTFTEAANLRRWRIVLAKGGNFTNKPFIGELFIGSRTTLTEYLNPEIDPYLKQVGGASERTEGGHFAGAVLRGQVHRFVLGFGEAGGNRTAMAPVMTFLDSHAYLLRPFIFQVDSDDTDFKKPVYLKKTDDGDVSRQAVGGMWNRLTLAIPVEEAWTEAAS